MRNIILLSIIISVLSCRRENSVNTGLSNSNSLPSYEYYVQIEYRGNRYDFKASSQIYCSYYAWEDILYYNTIENERVYPTISNLEEIDEYPFSIFETEFMFYIPSDSSMLGNLTFPIITGSYNYQYIRDSVMINAGTSNVDVEPALWMVYPKFIRSSDNKEFEGDISHNGHKITSIEYIGREYANSLPNDPNLYSAFIIVGELNAQLIERNNDIDEEMKELDEVTFRYRLRLLTNSI